MKRKSIGGAGRPGPGLPRTARTKWEALERSLREMGGALVAFSGGVDSTLLLKAAAGVLGRNVLAVIAASETYPEREVREARRLARSLGVRSRVIHTGEIDNPAFRRNPPLRCYYCKGQLFGALKAIAEAEGIPFVLDGSNADDAGDFRPGARAGREHGVRSPLREAGLTKDEIRRLSRRLGLPNWDKPSLACLASRFPYRTPIDRPALKRVGAAEDLLRGLGFGQLRVRHHGTTARIEVPPPDLARMLAPRIRDRVVAGFKKLGYVYVTLDLQGYRTGSLNETLARKPSPK